MASDGSALRCGGEAVRLLNCLAAKDSESCTSELAAFKSAPPLLRALCPHIHHKLRAVSPLPPLLRQTCSWLTAVLQDSMCVPIILTCPELRRGLGRGCAKKNKLKEFMLLEECPAPPPAKSSASEPKAKESKEAHSASTSSTSTSTSVASDASPP